MKPVLQIIREADRGNLVDDVQAALDQIRAAIDSHGGSGEISIKLKVKKKGDAFLFQSSLSAKIPEPPRVESIFFFDADSQEFSRKDPRQPEIPVVVEADFNNKRKHPQE